jgi:RNA polymerase sigma-70 factor (ECF subfamily)
MEFEKLVEENKDAVYRQMVRVCGNHTDAEDALGEALLKAHRASGSLRDQDAFRGWLAMIARRVCGRMKKREKATVSIQALEEEGFEMPAEMESIEEQMAEKQLKSCVQDALEDVPEIYREVYLMRDIEGLSGEETAEKLGISLAAMKSRLHRARGLVREKIDLAMCTPEDPA